MRWFFNSSRVGACSTAYQAFPLTEIPLSGEMSEGQKGAVSGEEKGDRLRWMR